MVLSFKFVEVNEICSEDGLIPNSKHLFYKKHLHGTHSTAALSVPLFRTPRTLKWFQPHKCTKKKKKTFTNKLFAKYDVNSYSPGSLSRTVPRAELWTYQFNIKQNCDKKRDNYHIARVSQYRNNVYLIMNKKSVSDQYKVAICKKKKKKKKKKI